MDTETIGDGTLLTAHLRWRRDNGRALAAVLWQCGPGWRMAASSVLGGGLGPRDYVINAQVDGDYRRTDPDNHLEELATHFGMTGTGVGLLTAANVSEACFADDHGVEVLATVGLGRPTWAAADPRSTKHASPAKRPAPGRSTSSSPCPPPCRTPHSSTWSPLPPKPKSRHSSTAGTPAPAPPQTRFALRHSSATPRRPAGTVRRSPLPLGRPSRPRRLRGGVPRRPRRSRPLDSSDRADGRGGSLPVDDVGHVVLVHRNRPPVPLAHALR